MGAEMPPKRGTICARTASTGGPRNNDRPRSAVEAPTAGAYVLAVTNSAKAKAGAGVRITAELMRRAQIGVGYV